MKSIFKYNGAKSSKSAREQIYRCYPGHFAEHRDVFCGGGSIFFDTLPSKQRWINDANPGLIAVYEALQKRPEQFVAACRSLPASTPEQRRTLHHRFVHEGYDDPAVRWFYLNGTSRNGKVDLTPRWKHRTYFVENGKWKNVYSDLIFEAARLLQDVQITCGDFEPVLAAPGEDCLLFIDPPYVRETELSPSSALYEKRFSMDDHHRLHRSLVQCRHNWLLTYDDHPLIHALYKDFQITHASWTYMGNDRRIVGKELIVTNYPVVTVGAAQKVQSRFSIDLRCEDDAA